MTAFIRLLISVAGLILPGYLITRAAGTGWRLAAAFPLSALLITEIIISLSCLNMPLNFTTVAMILGCLSAVLWLLPTRSGSVKTEKTELPDLPARRLTGICSGFAVIVVLIVFYRTAMYPLSGFDTFFRWEFLARAMVQYKTLAFYPPVTAHDYSRYFYTDGIPPLVASVYWWLYASMDGPFMRITSFSVAMQLATTLALIYYGTKELYNRREASFAMLAATSAPLLVGATSIGQETGFTALAVAGQLAFAAAAKRNPGPGRVIMVALFATLGGLTRDYGPLLAMSGFVFLAWQKETRKYLATYLIVAGIGIAPWYLRNWALTGNPLYSNPLPTGFPVNFVHTAIIMAGYKKMFALSGLTLQDWLSLLGGIVTGAPLAVIAGIPYGALHWQRLAPYLLTSLLVLCLWLCSISLTSGGPLYSLRVLTPAIVALAAPSGAALAMLADYLNKARRSWHPLVPVGFGLIALYTLTAALAHPFAAQDVLKAATYSHVGIPEFCTGTKDLVEKLAMTRLPPTRVLTSNCYLATLLQRDSQFTPVMVWSPEIAFVFDKNLDTGEIERRLIAMNIRLVYRDDHRSADSRILVQFPFFRAMELQHSLGTLAPLVENDGESLILLAPMQGKSD